jgi:hypothetical protein
MESINERPKSSREGGNFIDFSQRSHTNTGSLARLSKHKNESKGQFSSSSGGGGGPVDFQTFRQRHQQGSSSGGGGGNIFIPNQTMTTAKYRYQTYEEADSPHFIDAEY